jgi:hypothetical protein
MFANTKKIILLLSLLFLNSFQNKAQTFGNEWINYSQNYYKFPILSKGMYKISYSTLQNAGIPISSLNPNQLQIFGKRKRSANLY